MNHSMKAYLDALENRFRQQHANKLPDKLELCIGFDGRLVTQETYKVGAVLPQATPSEEKGPPVAEGNSCSASQKFRQSHTI